jgi:hypothetical protein
MPSSRTATMPADILIDSAVLKVSRGQVPTSTPIGASRGGLQFNPGREMRSVEYDGRRAMKMGLDRVVSWAPQISGNLLQANAENIKALEPGNTSVITAGAGEADDVQKITPKPANAMLAEGEYLKDVRLEYRRGNGGTFAVCFPYGLVTQWQLAGQDNNEAEFSVTIEARGDADDSDDVAPFYYEITGPDITAAP